MSVVKRTVLDVINSALIDMGRTQVNVLGGTPEATKVENICKDMYRHLLTRKLWPYQKKIIRLPAASDNTIPTSFIMPPDVVRLDRISYRVQEAGKTVFKEIRYVEPDEFLSRAMRNNWNSTDSLEVTTPDGATIFVGTNADPSYWTSFDDKNIVMDSYDRAQSTTLTESNCRAEVSVIAPWPTSPHDYIPIPGKYLPMYESMVKSAANIKVRQEASPVDDYYSKTEFNRFIHEARVAGDQNITGRNRRYGRRR